MAEIPSWLSQRGRLQKVSFDLGPQRSPLSAGLFQLPSFLHDGVQRIILRIISRSAVIKRKRNIRLV